MLLRKWSSVFFSEYKFVTLTDVLSKKCEKDAFFVEKLYNGYSLLYSSNMLQKFQSNGSEMWRLFVEACVLDVDGELCLREWTPIELNMAKTFLKFAAEMNIKVSYLIFEVMSFFKSFLLFLFALFRRAI